MHVVVQTLRGIESMILSAGIVCTMTRGPFRPKVFKCLDCREPVESVSQTGCQIPLRWTFSIVSWIPFIIPKGFGNGCIVLLSVNPGLVDTFPFWMSTGSFALIELRDVSSSIQL